jgi:hypothetical protein
MALATWPTASARAGELQYDPATDLIFYGPVPVARWYGERPMVASGLWHYRTNRRVPSCRHSPCGYPVPIYKAPRRWPAAVVRTYRVGMSAHAQWCAERYRSYDVRSDTWQPYRGPRRQCRSPYG